MALQLVAAVLVGCLVARCSAYSYSYRVEDAARGLSFRAAQHSSGPGHAAGEYSVLLPGHSRHADSHLKRWGVTSESDIIVSFLPQVCNSSDRSSRRRDLLEMIHNLNVRYLSLNMS